MCTVCEEFGNLGCPACEEPDEQQQMKCEICDKEIEDELYFERMILCEQCYNEFREEIRQNN